MIFPSRSFAGLRRGVLSTLLLLFCIWPTAAQSTPALLPASPALTADAVQEAFVRAAERIKPSVVTIYSERAANQPEAPQLEPGGENAGLGTGMVVDANGAILTNYHVVKNATTIYALFNADSERPERLLVTLAGFDEESDLAVLRLANRENLRAPLQPIEFADSDAVRVGEWAIAVGAPFDQAQSITVGIISAKGRFLDKDGRLSLQDYLQTDASINPGNSGGPLLNLEGKVIGINTAILSPSRFNVGIGFAVPSNAARQYWPLLVAGKPIERGFLGIHYSPLSDEIAREFNIAGGMQIGALAKRGDAYLGPAYAAGLKEGDIITHVDDQIITTTQAFRRLVANRPPGALIQLTVLRPEDQEQPTRSFSIVLDDWNIQNETTARQVAAVPDAAPTTQFSRSGLLLEDAAQLTADKRRELGLDTGAIGIVVTGVLPGSPADAAQIQIGSRIEKVRLPDKTWRLLSGKLDYSALEKTLPQRARLLFSLREKHGTLSYKLLQLP